MLPAAAQVLVNGYSTNPNYFFASQSDGSWCAGNSCVADTGTNSTWAVYSPGVPALRSQMLTGLAAMLALAGVILLKQARRRVSA